MGSATGAVGFVSLRQFADRVDLVFARLVHASARGDRLIATRHRSFIASHVIGGAIALLVLPVYLAVYGQPKLIEALAFSWFVSPIAIAMFLSWSGRYEAAYLISVANLSGLVTFAAAISGGLGSPENSRYSVVTLTTIRSASPQDEKSARVMSRAASKASMPAS